MVNAHKWKMPIPLDPESKVKTQYGVRTLPTLYIIDQEGEIVFSRVGYSPSMGDKIMDIISDLTPEPGEIPEVPTPLEPAPCEDDSAGAE
jgi:hypothetical protein